MVALNDEEPPDVDSPCAAAPGNHPPISHLRAASARTWRSWNPAWRPAPGTCRSPPTRACSRCRRSPSIRTTPATSSIAYMDYSLLTTGYAGIGVAVSDDGGATWQHTSDPPAGGLRPGGGHPIAQFDAQGHVFVSFMAATFLGPLPPITDPNGWRPRAPGLPVQQRHLRGPQRRRRPDLEHARGGRVAPLRRHGSGPLRDHAGPGHRHVPQRCPTASPTPTTAPCTTSGRATTRPASSPASRPPPAAAKSCSPSPATAGQTWQIQLKPPPGAAVRQTVLDNNNSDTDIGLGRHRLRELVAGDGRPAGGHLRRPGTDGGHFRLPLDRRRRELHAPRPCDGSGLSLRRHPTTPSRALTLANDQFRTQAIRDIVADPTRPGYVYVVDDDQISDRNGNPLDQGDVLFARSTDYGATWQTTFQVGPHAGANVLNDDNDGTEATGSPGDVIDGQALPRLAIDAQGDIAVIWYDTRRDPADTLLDVYGTVSTDGGQTFSPNFRVTDQSFNPNAGTFTDADGANRLLPGRRHRPGPGQRHRLRRLDRHAQRQPGRLLHQLTRSTRRRRRPATASGPTPRPPPRPTSARWSRATCPS